MGFEFASDSLPRVRRDHTHAIALPVGGVPRSAREAGAGRPSRARRHAGDGRSLLHDAARATSARTWSSSSRPAATPRARWRAAAAARAPASGASTATSAGSSWTSRTRAGRRSSARWPRGRTCWSRTAARERWTRSASGTRTLHRESPALIYASISGFGHTGPYAARGGFDLVAQGMSGLMSVTGEPGRPPVKCGVPVTDLTAGLLALQAILAAYVHRLRTGEGQHVDASLLEAGIALSIWESAQYFSGGGVPEPLGSAHRMFAPYQAVRCADGYITLGSAIHADLGAPRAGRSAGRTCWSGPNTRRPPTACATATRLAAGDRERHRDAAARALARAVRARGRAVRADPRLPGGLRRSARARAGDGRRRWSTRPAGASAWWARRSSSRRPRRGWDARPRSTASTRQRCSASWATPRTRSARWRPRAWSRSRPGGR